MTEAPSTLTNCASCCPRGGKLKLSPRVCERLQDETFKWFVQYKTSTGMCYQHLLWTHPAIAALKLPFSFHVLSQFHTVC